MTTTMTTTPTTSTPLPTRPSTTTRWTAAAGVAAKLLVRVIWVGTAVVWGGMFVLTHIPVVLPRLVESHDKSAHFLGYLVLGGAIFASLRAAGWRDPTLAVLIIGMAYGAIDEQSQKFVGRSCDLNDWFADVAGLAVAVTVGALVTKWFDRRAARSSW